MSTNNDNDDDNDSSINNNNSLHMNDKICSHSVIRLW